MNDPEDREVVLREGQYPVDEDGYDILSYWLGEVRLMTLLAQSGHSNKSMGAMKAAVDKGLTPTPYIQYGSRDFIVTVAADVQCGRSVWGYPWFRTAGEARALADDLENLIEVLKRVRITVAKE